MKHRGLSMLFITFMVMLLGYELIALTWRGPERPTWSRGAWSTWAMFGAWHWLPRLALCGLMLWCSIHWAAEDLLGYRWQPIVIASAVAAIGATGVLLLYHYDK